MTNIDVIPITGTTSNGVPYLAFPPASGATSAPVIVAWHLLDPPRTEAAMAAALPLDGVDAWRIYLGLPMTGARTPGGDPEALMALVQEDAVTKVYGAIQRQAVDEFPEALAELRARFGIEGDVPVGLLGGSLGSAVAATVLAERPIPVAAAVVVSPLLRLRSMIDSFGAAMGFAYPWHPEADRIAAEMDFVARAPEITDGVPVRVVVGADDLPAFVDAAREFAAASDAELHVLDHAAHALADEPGIDPAPQNAVAARVDALAAAWFTERLGVATD